MARTYRPMRWRPLPPDPAACLLLSRATGVSPVAAQILYNRGLTTPEAARSFLDAGRAQILDPFLLKDMDRAVALIRSRIAQQGPIIVYGDYDVDGVTGTTILVMALRALGAQVEYYIPDRFTEGYGLNVEALEEIHRRGHDFVLSVDTGISAVGEAEAAHRLGMTLVVTDHHEPGPQLPAVPALVNPKRRDCTYPFKGLSGVGVAFKLALALEAPNAWDLLDIVTLGTIADMVPLIGENRAIVREGLGALTSTQRVGLRALMEVSGLSEAITATHIAYSLGPRINALGRMGSAMLGVELLLTDDPGRARTLALHLDEQNRSRQAVEATILQEALQQAEQLPPEQREHVLVLAGEGWHHGVVGICATRVVEAYHRPAILIALDGDTARGSARSIPAFHMHRALSEVSDLFVKFGGHAAAAGMTLKRGEDVPVLRERLNRIAAQWLRPEDLVPELPVDAYVELGDVTEALLADLQRLEPNGVGNPTPVLAVSAATVLEARTMGKVQQHLRLLLKAKGRSPSLEAIGWNMAAARPPVAARISAAFFPERDTFQGRSRLRLTLKDLALQPAEPVAAGAPALRLSDRECLQWDPLVALDALGSEPLHHTWVDARPIRLAEAFQSLAIPEPEVAAAADPDGERSTVEPTRLGYLGAVAASPGRRTLVLTASPWASARLAAELELASAHLRGQVHFWSPGSPEPQGGAVVVAAYGAAPHGPFTDTVLYHPPYHAGQVPAAPTLHLLWDPLDWELAEASVGWPYPDRNTLVELYRLLKAGEATASGLARSLNEVPGPWNQLRFEAGLRVFREIGLVSEIGRLIAPNGGTRFDLDASPHFRKGNAGRASLAESCAGDWPRSHQAI